MRSDFASKRGQKQSEHAVENMILKKLETIFGRRSAKNTEKKININFEELDNRFKFAIEKTKFDN